ncbi:MAG: hypothetical protein ACXVBW_05555, partial [Bdellovibrionota bacterium]
MCTAGAGCTDYSLFFSRFAGMAEIGFQSQPIDPNTGSPLVDSVSRPLLLPATQLDVGRTAFATPSTVSFYVKNNGESAAIGIVFTADDAVNFRVQSFCPSDLAPTVTGKSNPDPCRFDVTFTPTTGFDTISSSVQLSYTSKGLLKKVRIPIRGTSVKEPSVRFDSASYSTAGPATAGTSYGELVLVLRFNGDLDPTKTIPPLDLGATGGLSGSLSFSALSAKALKASYQPDISAALGPLAAPSVYFIKNTQTTTLPVPSGMSSCTDRISASCYVVVSFAPSFTSAPFQSNPLSNASNWQATFGAGASLVYSYANTVLPLSQRKTTAGVAGIGLNGINLTPLAATASFGVDSTQFPIKGPFDLVSGGASANVAVFPVLNRDVATTLGVPLRIIVSNLSGVPAENVQVT